MSQFRGFSTKIIPIKVQIPTNYNKIRANVTGFLIEIRGKMAIIQIKQVLSTVWNGPELRKTTDESQIGCEASRSRKVKITQFLNIPIEESK